MSVASLLAIMWIRTKQSHTWRPPSSPHAIAIHLCAFPPRGPAGDWEQCDARCTASMARAALWAGRPVPTGTLGGSHSSHPVVAPKPFAFCRLALTRIHIPPQPQFMPPTPGMGLPPVGPRFNCNPPPGAGPSANTLGARARDPPLRAHNGPVPHCSPRPGQGSPPGGSTGFHHRRHYWRAPPLSSGPRAHSMPTAGRRAWVEPEIPRCATREGSRFLPAFGQSVPGFHPSTEAEAAVRHGRGWVGMVATARDPPCFPPNAPPVPPLDAFCSEHPRLALPFFTPPT